MRTLCLLLLLATTSAAAQSVERERRLPDPRGFALEAAAGAVGSLGGIVGTGVGVGLHWLINRNSDRNIGDKIVLPLFVISQGTFAALGSRVLGKR